MKLSRTGLDWLILVCLNATVPVVLGWKHYIGEVSAQIVLIAGLTSIVVANAVVVLAIRVRNKRQGKITSRSVGFGAIALAVLAAASTAFSTYRVPEQNEYLRLALSDTPLDQIHPERKQLLVELTRKQLANSQQEDRVIREMKPISPSLFSADSFADATVIRSVSQAYQDATAADFAYSDKQKRDMDEFRDKMSKVDPEFLKSFELTQRDREEATATTRKLEQECLNATLDLYNYAAAHAKDITIKNGELTFSNDGVRRDFSNKLEASKALFDTLQAIVQQQVTVQQQARRSAGISK
jgi:hypothetical protein